jgi:hypothetical protein
MIYRCRYRSERYTYAVAAEIKNVWSGTFTSPYALMAWCVIYISRPKILYSFFSSA